MRMNTEFGAFAEKAGAAAAMLAAMANAKRLFVLCYLAEVGEAPVAQIAEEVALSQSALSQHLARLRAEGLVATRRESQMIFYRLDDERILPILRQLRDLFCPEFTAAPTKGSSNAQ